MKNSLTYVVAAIVILILLTYAFTFTVRYDQVVVKTTFKKATPPEYNADGTLARDNAGDLIDPGSIVEKPGLKFRLPWPVHQVTAYSTRLQILDDQWKEFQTKDGYSVVVRTYMTWRIVDPHAFFVSLKDAETAKRQLSPMVESVVAETVGKYNFEDFVNLDPAKIKLTTIEKEMFDRVGERLTASRYGAEVVHMGIRRLVLPESVTSKVFERMRASRETMAAEVRASGDSTALKIRSEAQSASEAILEFARNRAAAIRSKGIERAAANFADFEKDPEFAIFLRQIEALKKILGENTSIVLDTRDLSPLQLLREVPGMASGDPPAAGTLAKEK